ncbi:hypothetical protein HT102_13315 [Hoyosella sp. G463]|uniref:Uncharacterized protein n=1 Tax=Lolliginicoccus lacisalsi TaxID=2742202 RepID=A0A927JF28_9ACTN|nr:hypothetical protein [Lolliginicoccus lacisalsi]MBD8507462.1 hypothetical protein [Lolliginicoccus lacisalsi]
MDTTTTIVVIIAVVAALLIAAVIWSLVTKKRKESRRAEATHLRTQAAEHSHDAGQREARAAQTAAKARAAQAEADAKAAEAAGLQHQAQTRRADAASARDTVNQEFDQANEVDPDLSTRGTDVGARPDEHTRGTTGRTFEAGRGNRASTGSASRADMPPQDAPERQQPRPPHDQQR